MASSLQQQFCQFLIVCASLIATVCYGYGYNGVTTKCLYPPIQPLPNGCSVSNLAVHSSTRNNLLISDWKCNQTVDSSEFDYIPVIKFLNMPIAFQRNQTYLVTIVDRTTNQLLWMVANVTALNKTLSPGSLPWHGIHKNSLILKSYQPPSMNLHSNNNHSIEILVFEEKFNKPSALSQMTHSTDNRDNFSLRNWLQLQTATGLITFCGPAGGGVVVAYKRPTGGPLYPISDHSGSSRPSGYPPHQYNPYPVPPAPAQYPPAGYNQPGGGSHNNPPAYQPNQNYPSAKRNTKAGSGAYSVSSNIVLLVIGSILAASLRSQGFTTF